MELQAALTDLAGAFERLGAALGQGVLQLAETAGQSVAEKARQKRGAGSRPNPPREGGRRRLSPQQRSRLKLQGRYMAATRFLSDADKAKVRRTREASGIEAAIEQALGIGGGKRGK